MKVLSAVPFLCAALAAIAAAPFAAGRAGSPASAAGPHDFAIDPVHSSFLFRIQHANSAWFYGAFAKVEGKFTLDPAAPEKGSIEVAIDAASIDTREEARDKHLRSPDFFDVKQYPKITFTSSKITKVVGHAKGDAFEVTGELELHGKKGTVTATAVKTGEGEFRGKRVGYEATFTVKRSDYGMTWGIADQVLGDEVTLIFAVSGVQAAEGK